METLYKTNSQDVKHNTTNASQKVAWRFTSMGRLNIIPRSSWRTLVTKDSMNDLDPIGVPEIWKPKLKIRKQGGSDIKWSNLYWNQATHFTSYIKSLNAKNSCCNRKKQGTTFNAGLTICVSSTNKGKTQVGWVVVVGQRVQRWARTNNVPPNGSPCCVRDSNKMIMRSLCWEAWEKYNGHGHV